jgi:hypothetical protein
LSGSRGDLNRTDIIDHLLAVSIRLEAELGIVTAELAMIVVSAVGEALVDVISASGGLGTGSALVREHLAEALGDG